MNKTGNPIHGHASGNGSPTYSSWAAMKNRCKNPIVNRYGRYGGRGIKVCERWQVFANFLADMGERPSMAHCISRLDHSKDYEPGNAEWGLKGANVTESNNRRWQGVQARKARAKK